MEHGKEMETEKRKRTERRKCKDLKYGEEKEKEKEKEKGKKGVWGTAQPNQKYPQKKNHNNHGEAKRKPVTFTCLLAL